MDHEDNDHLLIHIKSAKMKSSRVAAIFREILPTILRTEYAQCNVKSTS